MLYPTRGAVCRPRVEGPSEGSRDPGPANSPPRRIQRVSIFQPVCIVFISPPRVELRILSMYFACKVCVKCV